MTACTDPNRAYSFNAASSCSFVYIQSSHFCGVQLSVRTPDPKKAVQYARKQQPYMENYLLDPRCQISNNLAENAIRPFTVGRKNWLFSDTVKGVRAS